MIGAYAAGNAADSQSSGLPEIGQGVGMEGAAVVLHVDGIESEAVFWGSVLGEERGLLRGGNGSQSGRPTRQTPGCGI